MTGLWARLESDACRVIPAWSATLPSSAFLMLLLITSCIDDRPKVAQKEPAFDVTYHCDKASRCRLDEYDEESSAELRLCLDAMGKRVNKADSRGKLVLAAQQVECSFGEEACEYVSCMTFHFSGLHD